MPDPESQSSEEQARRLPARFLLWVSAVVVGLLLVYIAFSIFYTIEEPERMANPAEVFDEQVPSEGVGVPDGGELTNEPTQAAPDSPARDADLPQ